MSMLVKGVPVPVLIGLALLIVGGMLHIIGLATPYWHSQTETNNQQRDILIGHYGLFVGCQARGAVDVVDCNGDQSQGYVVATRAMEFLGLIFGIICMTVTGLWFFLELKKFNLIFMIVSLVSGFLSGLFGLIGIIIYGAAINNADVSNQAGQLFEYTLGWSFALCTLSSCIAVIAVSLIGIGSRMVK